MNLKLVLDEVNGSLETLTLIYLIYMYTFFNFFTLKIIWFAKNIVFFMYG